MEEIDSARAIKFGNEIIVEVQGTDVHGAIEVLSYQFTSEDGEQELMEAAEKIKWHSENGWNHTKSYQQNAGLEIVDWSEFTED
jgi:hypothetical protein